MTRRQLDIAEEVAAKNAFVWAIAGHALDHAWEMEDRSEQKP